MCGNQSRLLQPWPYNIPQRDWGEAELNAARLNQQLALSGQLGMLSPSAQLAAKNYEP